MAERCTDYNLCLWKSFCRGLLSRTKTLDHCFASTLPQSLLCLNSVFEFMVSNGGSRNHNEDDNINVPRKAHQKLGTYIFSSDKNLSFRIFVAQ